MESTNKKSRFNKILIVIGILLVCSITINGSSIFEYLFAFFIVYVILVKVVFRRKKDSRIIPKLTRKKEDRYSELGMSHKEIVFFRETMSTAKKQILTLEKNMQATSKLKAIDLRYDTIKVSQAMFKEIVKEPNKLHQSDRFLYNHLPNLVELTSKYIEINQHQIKNKETYDALNKSAKAIEDVSQLICKDYANFVQDDIDDLDVEISIANQNIEREKTVESYKEEKKEQE